MFVQEKMNFEKLADFWMLGGGDVGPKMQLDEVTEWFENWMV